MVVLVAGDAGPSRRASVLESPRNNATRTVGRCGSDVSNQRPAIRKVGAEDQIRGHGLPGDAHRL
jgi:hypothetical protein